MMHGELFGNMTVGEICHPFRRKSEKRSSIQTHVIAIVAIILIFFTSLASGLQKTSVVVAGADSAVGFYVFKKLLSRKNFDPIGLVQDKAGLKALIEIGATANQVKICDIRERDQLKGHFDGASKCVMCTSSKPKKKIAFQVKNFFRRLLGRERPARFPKDLYYPKDQTPYTIDFVGQKHIIDECSKAGVEHIVLLGNMGGYRDRGTTTGTGTGTGSDESGKVNSPVDISNSDPKKGNILKWKRATERYLIKRSFFTIIHAGKLTDDKGGQREIIWDTDDALLRTSFKRISKEDAAEVIVQSLIWKEAIGKSIDIANLPVGQGNPNVDWLRFWARPGTCYYPVDATNE